MVLFIIVVLAAIAFEYINGFHDAANAIATVVSTKVLTPRQAIALAAFFNLTGALMGTAVASTIGKGIVDTKIITMTTVLCALPDGPYAQTSAFNPQLTSAHLGRCLHRFGINSRTMRIGGQCARGYELADFTEAFARFLKS